MADNQRRDDFRAVFLVDLDVPRFVAPLFAAGRPIFFADFFAVFFAVFLADFFADFLGTLPPACRASDKPIATAWLRLVTFLPLRPLRKVPSFISCMARFTFACAFLPYFAIVLHV